ncbi:MAG: CPBP family intramembrane metalloprotease [Firmicutes bacterium]|nr:CPBP family intramembrane metalloprotease [Bacillota bacterium]
MDELKKAIKLRRVFIAFLTVFILNLVFPLIGSASKTQRLWLLVNIIVSILALALLRNEKLPSRRSVVLGAALAILVGITSPVAAVTTFLAFVAATRIFELTDGKLSLLRRPLRRSILWGVGVGFPLGVINLFLAGGQTLRFAPSFYAFLVSLNPGISEEIIYRFFIYAFSVYLLDGRITTRKETIWVYVLMIVPHVLMHFPDLYFVNGVLHFDLGTLLIGPVILGVLFGLPMTLLMVNRDLTAAMITHTVVDLIRFIFLGLPF